MIKILAVDDERDILDEIAEALTDEGHEVFCVESVDDALDVLRSHTDIGLVVTDLKMPGKTGADLISEARAEFERHISFIIMSGHGSPSTYINGLDIKKFPFLRKPLDIDRFIETVETTLSPKEDRDCERRSE